MKTTINKDVCIGCGLCVSICPEVYKMDEDKAIVICNPVSHEFESKVLEAKENCPVEAISVD